MCCRFNFLVNYFRKCVHSSNKWRQIMMDHNFLSIHLIMWPNVCEWVANGARKWHPFSIFMRNISKTNIYVPFVTPRQKMFIDLCCALRPKIVRPHVHRRVNVTFPWQIELNVQNYDVVVSAFPLSWRWRLQCDVQY